MTPSGTRARRSCAPSTPSDIDILHLASELVVDAVVQPEDLREELVRRFQFAGGTAARVACQAQPDHARLMPQTGAALEAELLDVAVEAARAAGAELLARWRRPLEVGTKSTPTDPVTEADVERRAGDPRCSRPPPPRRFDPRRGGGRDRRAARCAGWSTRSTGPSTTSTACRHSRSASRSKMPTGGIAAVVLDPVSDELFSATRSGPAALPTASRIAPSGCESARPRARRDRLRLRAGGAGAAGVRSSPGSSRAPGTSAAQEPRRSTCAGARRAASTPITSAASRPWDIAAGTLICERAGLAVRTLEAGGGLPSGVAVAAPGLIGELMALVETADIP